MATSRRNPDMAEVGRLAGVSHQTVSRVLNNSESVRPDTRKKVLDAISALGYRRNMSARSLVTRRSHIIGVIVAEGSYYGPGQTSSAIQTAARELGYATLVAAIRTTDQDEVAQVIDMLLDHAVEGIVVIAPHPPLVEELRTIALQIPLVLVADGVEVSEGMHAISVDQYYGGKIATEHLLSAGHKDVMHIAGPEVWFDARNRASGWRDALQQAKVPVPTAVEGDWSAQSGYQAGLRILAGGLPDAVFCANDLMALGLLSALSDKGVKVPDDVAIVGFDDFSGTAYFHPPLTTVRQPFQDLGAACVVALFDAISGKPVHPKRMKPELVVRRSTARPC